MRTKTKIEKAKSRQTLPHAKQPLKQDEGGDDVGGPVRLITKPELLDRIGVTYPTIWQWMRAGKFPRSRELGGKAAWIESEVDEWIAALPVRRLKGDRRRELA